MADPSGSSSVKRERYSFKAWTHLRCITKAVGDLKHGVGMPTTGNLASWVETFQELWARDSPQDKNRSATACQSMAGQATLAEAQAREHAGSF